MSQEKAMTKQSSNWAFWRQSLCVFIWNSKYTVSFSRCNRSKNSSWCSIYLCVCLLCYQQKQPYYFNSAFSHSFDRKKKALKMGKQQNFIYLNQFGGIINWKSFTCIKFCPLTEMLSFDWNGNVLKISIKVQMTYSRSTIQQIKYTKSGIFAHKLQLCWIEYVLL